MASCYARVTLNEKWSVNRKCLKNVHSFHQNQLERQANPLCVTLTAAVELVGESLGRLLTRPVMNRKRAALMPAFSKNPPARSRHEFHPKEGALKGGPQLKLSGRPRMRCPPPAAAVLVVGRDKLRMRLLSVRSKAGH